MILSMNIRLVVVGFIEVYFIISSVTLAAKEIYSAADIENLKNILSINIIWRYMTGRKEYVFNYRF